MLRLFSTAVIDQVLLSGSNLLVGLLLIRFTTDSDYALYVLVQSALLLVVSAQGAWTGGALAVMASKRPLDLKRSMLSAITFGQRRVLRYVAAGALPLPFVGYLLGLCSGIMALVLTGAVIAAWGALRRDFLRILLLIYSKPHTLLRADTVYVCVLLVGVSSVCAVWTLYRAGSAILGTTLVLAAAAWAGSVAFHRGIAHDPGWSTGDAGAAWRELRTFGLWSLMGGVIYWLFAQSYGFILASRLNLKAVTDVNAARLLLMPAFVLSTGIQSLLAPMAAGWNVDLGFTRLVRRLLAILLIIGVIDLVYFVVVWLCRDWLTGSVLHKQIGDRDLLLLLWAAVAIIGLMRDVLQCGVVALGRFKSVAGQVGLAAFVSLTLMWFGTAWWGTAAVLIGQIVGELVNIAGTVRLLYLHGRSESLAHAAIPKQ